MSTPSTTLDELVDTLKQQHRMQKQAHVIAALEKTILPHIHELHNWRLVDPVTIECEPIDLAIADAIPVKAYIKAFERAKEAMHSMGVEMDMCLPNDVIEPFIRYQGPDADVPYYAEALPRTDAPSVRSLRSCLLFAAVWKRDHVKLEELLHEETEKLRAFIREPKNWDASQRATSKLYTYDPRLKTWRTRYAVESRVRALFSSDAYYLEFQDRGELKVRIVIKDEEKW